MGDEHRVIMVEITVAHGRTCNMGHRVVTRQLNEGFVTGQLAVCSQREGLQHRVRPQPRKKMRHSAPFVVASLRADVVERAGVGNVDFHALVEPCRSRAVFKHGQFRTLFHAHDKMQDRVAVGLFVQVNQIDGL